MSETKIIYHINEENTPYLIKVAVSPDLVTLAHFKAALKRPNYKYFFKSVDDDYGIVKEQIIDDDHILPSINGRVVSWLVACGTSSEIIESQNNEGFVPYGTSGTVDSSDNLASTKLRDNLPHPEHRSNCYGSLPSWGAHGGMAPQAHGYSKQKTIAASGFYKNGGAVLKNEDYLNYYASDDDSCLTEKSPSHRANLHRHRGMAQSIASDSDMSLNIVNITLNTASSKFLGITIVGQNDKDCNGGIYIGSIKKGGAVALDGRIEVGDMLLRVNNHSFENISNEDAIRTLQEAMRKPGLISLVVAKCWDANADQSSIYKPAFDLEPVQKLDPSDWVRHINEVQNKFYCSDPNCSVTTFTSESSSVLSSLPESERYANLNLTIHSDMAAVVKVMAQPGSGLKTGEKKWLKTTVPNAFCGSDVVDWLQKNVDGFAHRRDAQKYASNLLKAGYIRHMADKLSFSDQGCYTFGVGDEGINLISQASGSSKDLPPKYTKYPPNDYCSIYGSSHYAANQSIAKKNQTCTCLLNHAMKQVRKKVGKLHGTDKGKDDSRKATKKMIEAHGGAGQAKLAHFDSDSTLSSCSSSNRHPEKPQ